MGMRLSNVLTTVAFTSFMVGPGWWKCSHDISRIRGVSFRDDCCFAMRLRLDLDLISVISEVECVM